MSQAAPEAVGVIIGKERNGEGTEFAWSRLCRDRDGMSGIISPGSYSQYTDWVDVYYRADRSEYGGTR